EEEPQPHQAPPAHQPPPVEEPQPHEGYPGGSRDLSLLSDYHKHRAIPIWDAEPQDQEVLKKSMPCITNGKK
ncbi:hypothetical protein A2U01_0056067, partial [Trifolium medium]|nr:hypothetical protein [Trifolium medium]